MTFLTKTFYHKMHHVFSLKGKQLHMLSLYCSVTLLSFSKSESLITFSAHLNRVSYAANTCSDLHQRTFLHVLLGFVRYYTVDVKWIFAAAAVVHTTIDLQDKI